MIARSTLKVAGLLNDSIFQGDLLLGEEALRRYDPDVVGYRYFLIETPADKIAAVQQALQRVLGDYGFRTRNDRRAAEHAGWRAEHLSRDVPESWRAGPHARHDRLGGRPMAKRAGAPRGIGPAPRGRLSA